MTNLVEARVQTGAYNFNFEQKIVDTKKHGRLLLAEGLGGDDVNGYQYRWRHGSAIKLHSNDTFNILDEPWNDGCLTIEAVLRGYDDTRPALDWAGVLIERMARGAK